MAEQKSPTGLKKVTRAPKALATTAALANALVDYLGKTRGLGGITVQLAEAGMVIGYKPLGNPPENIYAAAGGGGGAGLPAGFTFRQFTVCSNGTPTNYFWPTWDTDPS